LPVIFNQDNSKTISFEIQDSTGKKITHEFTIRPNEYMIDFNIKINGADQLFSQHTINFEWNVESPRIEKDFNYELTQSHLGYLEDEKFNFEYISKEDIKELKKVSWIGIKQQFFLSSLIAKEKFTNSVSQWNLPHDTVNNFLSRVNTNASYNLQSGPVASASLQLYFGPSDYNILKKYNNQLENIVPYGSGIFAFVKYINRHFLLPVFDFLRSNIANMGIVILLLTLLIRLITSPILYKSYLSGAKMKVLKPEVDALKEKYKDDQQTFGMEQMKLWRSAGVSPLGGCIPALLQIPIFMSLYYFFQSNIDLRGKNFLWANDLAQYDSIAQLPFSIPFYGDHVSLFTITAVITSLLISLYGMSNMQDNSNPMMKYMPYIFPVLLLGVFNKLPSALTWYYTISNTITLILQIVIQKYIINHDKILTEITENRKKPAKKSKMQERIEAMQESQKKLLEMKNKSGK
jgi:YidC/Oxa1 family membrane protein insertase